MTEINKRLPLGIQKQALEEALTIQRKNLSKVQQEILMLETKKKTILQGILFNRREILRVERDIRATVQE